MATIATGDTAADHPSATPDRSVLHAVERAVAAHKDARSILADLAHLLGSELDVRATFEDCRTATSVTPLITLGETLAMAELDDAGGGALLAVPLLDDDQPFALLTLRDAKRRHWSRAEIALAEAAAARSWPVVRRALAEQARDAHEAEQVFLTGWRDSIRHQTAPAAIVATTLQQLGEQLGCTRLLYARIEEATELVVRQHWGEREQLVGTPLPLARLGRWVLANHLAGRTIVADDIDDHPLFDEDNLALFRRIDAAALVSVPLVRDGNMRALLSAQQDAPRRWTETETRLIREVADRLWPILERAEAEQARAEGDALLAAFMAHAPVGMHLKDADGRYLRANPELAHAIGRPVEGIAGRHAADLLPADIAARLAAMEARALDGEPVSEEFVAPSADRYAAFQSIVFPVDGGGDARTGGFTLDLTERKEAEVALQRSREALYQSEKLSALGSLLAGVSHELNNPLSIVVAQAVMMERQAGGTEMAERAFKIRKAADRCARIVQTFLAMARQKKPERTAVDLNAVAQAALELAEYGLRADGVGITRTLTPDLPRLSADSDQLHQIVTNLVVNAQQAMFGQAGLRWLTVRTAPGPEPRTVILEVADTGPGIGAEARRRIFEPFYTTKAQGEGTGVGLSFSQGLAEAHGGRLTLVPSDKGAVFRLTLPIDERLTLPRIEPTPTSSPAPITRRALVIDDEEEIAASLADFLAIEGFACEIAVGGAAAQARLADGTHYDLIVSDLRMPGVDGPALYAWIVAERPDLAPRTAFTTGDTLGSGAARFLTDAGRPVLEKPFMLDSVRQFLSEIDGR